MSEPCSDLIRFADGELDPESAAAFRAHLKTCAVCRSGLVEAMQLHARLTTLSPGGPMLVEPPVPPIPVPAPVPPASIGERGPKTGARSRKFTHNRALIVGCGAGLAALVVAAVLVMLRTPSPPSLTAPKQAASAAPTTDSGLTKTAFATIKKRPYDLRFAYADAGDYRPQAGALRGSTPSVASHDPTPHPSTQRAPSTAERVSYAAIGELEQRGDRHGLAIARAWNGEKLPDIVDALRQIPQTPAIQADRAALEVLQTSDDNVEAVLTELEALRKNPDLAAARAARWNYALLLARLHLPFSAAAAFREIAAENEPGWSNEASQRAQEQDELGQGARKRWLDAYAAGQAMVAGGPPIALQLVQQFPGLMRGMFYDAVRTAPTRDRVLALAPVGAELDRIADQHLLGDHVQRIARVDFARRARLAAAYARVLTREALSPAVKAELLTDAAPAATADITMGAMFELDAVVDHRAAFQRMVKQAGDPWFELVLAQEDAVARRKRGDWLGAESQLQAGLKQCNKAVAYRCMALAVHLGHVYQDLHRVPEALGTLRAYLNAARSAGEWGQYKALLFRLADVELFNGSIATARAYARELLLAEPEHGQRNSATHMVLANAAIHDLDGPAARRELDRALQGRMPDLAAVNVLADIGRMDPQPADLARLQDWLGKLRASGGLTPGERVLADEIEGRLVIERDRSAGIAILERAIAAAGPAPADIIAQRARSGAYAVLAFDAALRGDYSRVLALTAEQLGVPAPGPCTVAMVAEAERAVIAVRGRDAQDRGVSPSVIGARRDRLVVPEDMARALAGCNRVGVMAPAVLQGEPRILPPDLPWSYVTGVSGRTSVSPAGPLSPRAVIVANVEPPAYLHLPTLLPWAVSQTPPATLSGPMATPRRVLSEIRDATEIQFHTHAQVDAGISDASHLVLSPDETGYALTAEAIRKTELRGHPIVVLAACHSAQGARYQHTAWSLPDAFLSVGARAVLAAGSSIPDLEAGPFFTGVLDQMRAGVDPVRALRDARVRALQKDPSSWIADVILFE